MVSYYPSLSGRVPFITAEVAPGINLIPAAGHTPGNLIVQISSGNTKLICSSDVIQGHITSLQHPEWYSIFEMFPDERVRSRKNLLERAVSEDLFVMAYHVSFPAFAHISKNGKRYRWEPVTWSWNGWD